jgi:hypothetical protein
MSIWSWTWKPRKVVRPVIAKPKEATISARFVDAAMDRVRRVWNWRLIKGARFLFWMAGWSLLLPWRFIRWMPLLLLVYVAIVALFWTTPVDKSYRYALPEIRDERGKLIQEISDECAIQHKYRFALAEMFVPRMLPEVQVNASPEALEYLLRESDIDNREQNAIEKYPDLSRGFACMIQEHAIPIKQPEQWHHTKELKYFLAFLEFTESGNPIEYTVQDKEIKGNTQLEALLAHLRTIDRKGKKNFVISFIHGWRNDASIGNNDVRILRLFAAYTASFLGERCENAKALKDQAKRKAEEAKFCDYEVTAVFLGWRGARSAEEWLGPTFGALGKSFDFYFGQVPAYLTLFDRKPISERIGPTAINALRQIDRVIYGRYEGLKARPENRMITFGHSLGGNMIASALRGEFVERVKLHQPRSIMTPPFGDLIVLLNPASEAKNWTDIQRAMQERIRFEENYATAFPPVGELDQRTISGLDYSQALKTAAQDERIAKILQGIDLNEIRRPVELDEYLNNREMKIVAEYPAVAQALKNFEAQKDALHGICQKLRQVGSTYEGYASRPIVSWTTPLRNACAHAGEHDDIILSHTFWPRNQRPIYVSLTAANSWPVGGVRRSDCNAYWASKKNRKENPRVKIEEIDQEAKQGIKLQPQYDSPTHDLFPAFKFDFRPLATTVELNLQRYLEEQNVEIDLQKEKDEGPLDRYCKASTSSSPVAIAARLLVDVLRYFPFMNTDVEQTRTIGHLNPIRAFGGKSGSNIRPSTFVGTTHELTIIDNRLPQEAVTQKAHNADFFERFLLFFRVNTKAEEIKKLLSAKYAEAPDLRKSRCRQNDNWLVLARNERPSYWSSTLELTELKRELQSRFVQGYLASSMRPIVRGNDPFWNVRVFDTGMQGHGDYDSFAMICTIQQLVIDNITDGFR